MEAPETGRPQRLHPFTLGYRVLRSLPQLLIAFVPIVFSTSGRTAALASLVVTVGFGAFFVPLLVAQYARFRYRVSPGEITIQRGVFSQQTRVIPIERIQRVEIVQPLLARVFGTARVDLMTAGGAGAEGTLEYVSLAEAHRLRDAVRAGGGRGAREAMEGATAPAAASAPETAAPLFRLSFGDLLRKGALRFSLAYIAVAFSLLQSANVGVEDIVDFFLQHRHEAYARYLPSSALGTALVTLAVALVLSWLAGLATTVNGYYGFTIFREGPGKLRTVRGLLGRSERTLPLRKVQALVFEANFLMQPFGYLRLAAQTMGLDDKARGAAPVIPFGRAARVAGFARDHFGYRPPPGLLAVSPFFRRRALVRLHVALVVAACGPAFWLPEALWLLALSPALVLLASAQYRAHGYYFDGEAIVVQRGALWQRRWAVPLARAQSFSLSATYFQRRLGLVTLHLDTAGAMEMGGPAIRDLEQATGQALFALFRAGFQRPGAVADEAEVEHDGHGFAQRRPLQVEHRPPDGKRPRGGADEAEPPRHPGGEQAEKPL